MWIIGISKLHRKIFCFTVYDQPATKHRGNRTLGTSKCKWFCSILRVNVLLFSDFNASGVLNNNGTPCFVISLTATFFLSFLEWPKLRIITGDLRWIIWRGKFSLPWSINYLCWYVVSFVQPVYSQYRFRFFTYQMLSSLKMNSFFADDCTQIGVCSILLFKICSMFYIQSSNRIEQNRKRIIYSNRSVIRAI